MAKTKRKRVGRGVACPNPKCPKHGLADAGNVTGGGYYPTRTGRRRRYDCGACDVGFSLNTGTPYHRLHASRDAFDTAAKLAVEGVGASSIGTEGGRVLGKARSTISASYHRVPPSPQGDGMGEGTGRPVTARTPS